MTPERYRQVGALYHAALDLDEEDRPAFLERECAGDEDLRREVESLIASHEKGEDFLAAPAIAVAAGMLAGQETDSMSGRTIGRYRIRSLIGVGGMGRVYLAEDIELERRIALKLLPLHATDDVHVQRFRQEARAASALNHPSIVTVHEIGPAGGSYFIATEFIDGVTLRARIAGTPMAVGDVLDIAAQVVSAVQAAHEAGIVHRDIKPENIMLRPDGLAKVLDFGLAKLTGAPAESVVETKPGMVMGTAAYMSPEQARGHGVDHRTDLWSVGVVLYEMLTGRPPFTGETASDLLAAILKTEPPPLAGNASPASDGLQRVVQKCLKKDRQERYQRARELLDDLQALRDSPRSGRTMSRRSFAIVGAAVLLAAAAALYLVRPAAVGPKTIEALAVLPFTNPDPASQHLSDGLTEELIDRLSRVPQLRVMARTTVFTYKRQPIDPRRAGNELRVPAVLVGTFRPDGNRYSIHAELVDVRDGSQIWGGRYTGTTADLVQIENRILADVSRRISPSLTDQQYERIAQQQTGSPEAYELYLRGRQSGSIWTLPTLQKAVWYYREAISRDASFAPAYAGLAEAYSLMDHTQDAPAIQPAEIYEGAIESAQKALELNPNSADAHAALGHLFIHQGRFDEGERHIRRALELNPNSVQAGQWNAVLLVSLGRTAAAVEQVNRTRALDPLSVPANWVTAHILFYGAGDLDKAIKACRRVIEISPDFAQAYYVLAQALALKGEYGEAEKALAQGARLRRPQGELDEQRALVLALSGRGADALALLKKITREMEHPSPRWMAFAYAAAGDHDKAIHWFQTFARENPNYARIASIPPPCANCRSLRDDPRFRAYRRELGLPD
jgi:TolB-like protein/Flp pilus assembly protein TadD